MTLPYIILIPMIAGLIMVFLKNGTIARWIGLLASLATLAIVINGIHLADAGYGVLQYSRPWLGGLNSSFAFLFDGPSQLLCLLTAIAYPVILIATWQTRYERASVYFGLLMLVMAGMLGVFLASDALLFYFFWELALIPMYFLCGQWGSGDKIRITFKFFIYTFIGSLIMLLGVIYLYTKTPDASFAWESFKQVRLTLQEQQWFFWFFFIAFAIKMPIFPLHTWQPDTYSMAPISATMVLSGIMVKMGLFGVVRWLLPVFPEQSANFSHIIIVVSVLGLLYASVIALRQDSIKRLIAYSSIAHIGLMNAALFTGDAMATQGAYFQFFSHGINVIGLWIVVEIIEEQTGVTQMSKLGALATKAPWLTALLVIIVMANIALPLTNGFVGEFLMLTGLFGFKSLYGVLATLAVILSAIYMLGFIRKTFFGTTTNKIAFHELNSYQAAALIFVVVLIFTFGVFPQQMLDLGAQTLNQVTATLTN